MIISTHLIADVQSVLDDVIFVKDGEIVVHDRLLESLREKKGKARKPVQEVFKC